MKHRTIVTLLLTVTIATLLAATRQPADRLSYLRSLSNQQLFDRGVRASDQLGMPDSALIYFSILTERYQSRMSQTDKKLCAMAHVYIWAIHFDQDCNYAKQYESLTSALDICTEAQLEMPEIYQHFGNMYHTLADLTHDQDFKRKAIDHYKQSFWAAQNGQRRLLRLIDVSMTNMAICAYELAEPHLISKEVARYREVPELCDSATYQYNLLLLQGKQEAVTGHHDKAAETFDRQIRLTLGKPDMLRPLIIACSNKAGALAGAQRYGEAIACMQEARRLAEQNDLKDIKAEVYDKLSRLYEQQGSQQQATDYLKRYYLLKDSIINYSQIAALDDYKLSHDIQDANNKYKQLQTEAQRIKTTTAFVALLAATVLVFLTVLWHKNRQLRRRNQALYEKNQQLLTMENEVTRQRRESNISREGMEKLLSSILAVMEDTSEICSPDFSIDRLAKLAGSNQNYVSHAINETYHCNFNTFLNRYRIKVACHRLSDVEHYGRYTMESISNGVGFKSRTSFTTAFKLFTGQTPSEYQRMAQDSHKAQRGNRVAPECT